MCAIVLRCRIMLSSQVKMRGYILKSLVAHLIASVSLSQYSLNICIIFWMRVGRQAEWWCRHLLSSTPPRFHQIRDCYSCSANKLSRSLPNRILIKNMDMASQAFLHHGDLAHWEKFFDDLLVLLEKNSSLIWFWLLLPYISVFENLFI
jgi:hypothetical protein